MQESNIINISANHPCYPSDFKHTKPSVSNFYAHGNIELLRNGPRVAIVGTRLITTYGKDVTQLITKTAVQAGMTIVSGLAFGVDKTAHQTALDSGGATIAVLPSSLHNIYPASHQGLADRILASGGLLISEHHPENSPNKFHFVKRNRLIAALSDMVIIPEAGLKSGSRHTADFALQLGKPVAMVPGPINSPLSAYPNQQINNGAVPIVSAEDFLDKLKFNNISFNSTANQTDNIHPVQSAIANALSQQNMSDSQLIDSLKLDIALFNTHITMLEIKGTVVRINNYKWGLAK